VAEIDDVHVTSADSEPGVGAGAVLRAVGGAGKQIKLPAKAIVGRAADCDVVLDDDSVSRRHALLARDERGFYRVCDLDSGNGTFLDGKEIGKEPVLVPAGARLRFGEVELVFCRPQGGVSRRKLLLGALVAMLALVGAFIAFRPARRDGAESAAAGPEPGERATALSERAQAAFEGERFEEAAHLAKLAIDKDPHAPAPRKLLAQARREQQSEKVFVDATAKAQVGLEDEALKLLAKVSPQSRFFARARIRARDLAQTILRTRGAACRSARRENAQEIADKCGRALDVKCQTGTVKGDVMFKALRAAEKKLRRRVAWSCPRQLAPLFAEERVR
jgi:hypothetical protein